MDDNRLKGLAGLVGLALVGTMAVGAVVGSQSAANHLQPKAVSALRAAGLHDVKVDFTGREAKLSGGQPTERAKAISVVEDINGVRWAKFRGKPLAAPAPAAVSSLKLSRSDLGTTISGVVPSADAAAALKTAAAEAFGGTVSGDFAIDPSVASADWIAAMPEAFGDLAGVQDLQVGIGGGGSIQLGGSIESQAGADRVRSLVAAAIPGLTVDSTITVDAGALSPGDAATVNSATIYFGRGSAKLSAASTAELDRVVDVMLRNADLKLEAGGHAGPTDPVKGAALSDARVVAVKAYLVGAGIDADRVTTTSFGSGEKTSAAPYSKQYRRVDFAVEGN